MNHKSIRINDDKYKLDHYIGSGGEGEIYKIDDSTVAKIYHDDILEKNPGIEIKITNICNILRERPISTNCAYPKSTAYALKPRMFVGFSMDYYEGLPELSKVKFVFRSNDFPEFKSRRLSDETAIKLIYEMFKELRTLHEYNIIVGDIKPENILVDMDNWKPVFIDLDSAKFGEENPCTACTEKYLDPDVIVEGVNGKGSYNYTTLSDIFALTCVSHELYFGISPFFLRSKPSPLDTINKQQGTGIFQLVVEGPGLLQKMGRQESSSASWHQIKEQYRQRLSGLYQKDEGLYNHLYFTLLQNEREYIGYRLPSEDSSEEKVTTTFNIPEEDEDKMVLATGVPGYREPDDPNFLLFMKTMNINIDMIVCA